MEGLGTAPARTEADLCAALAEQARRAPSADDVLSALRQADDLRPRTAPRRPRHQPAWAAPLAAAAAMVLVIGLAVVVSHGLFGSRQRGGARSGPAAPLPFYVATDAAITKIVVRSTATGKVVAVVPVTPGESSGADLIAPALATGANGTFYVAALEHGVRREQIYRFRVTAAGHVTGFARVPGGGLRPGWAADSLAASANGSRIAVGASYYLTHVNPGPEQSDQVVVINTHTGAQRTWRGGSLAGGYPAHLSVEQMSAATGRSRGVIYRRYLGDTSMSGTATNPLALIADATGSRLILDSEVCGLHCSNEFNGWLDGGRLVPLRPAGFAHREAAEAW